MIYSSYWHNPLKYTKHLWQARSFGAKRQQAETLTSPRLLLDGAFPIPPATQISSVAARCAIAIFLALPLGGLPVLFVQPQQTGGVRLVNQQLPHLLLRPVVLGVGRLFLCQQPCKFLVQAPDRGQLFRPNASKAFFAALWMRISPSCSARYFFEYPALR